MSCKGCQALIANMAFMLGYTFDKWTEEERQRIWAVITKYDKSAKDAKSITRRES